MATAPSDCIATDRRPTAPSDCVRVVSGSWCLGRGRGRRGRRRPGRRGRGGRPGRPGRVFSGFVAFRCCFRNALSFVS